MPSETQAWSPYVQTFLDRLQGVRDTNDGWTALCPVHERDGEHTPSLRVTIGEEGRILVCCRTGCPTPEILSALDLRHGDLFPAEGESPMERLCRRVEDEPSEDDLQLRHEVYSFLLDRLTLNAEDTLSLQNRGLSDEAIRRGGYRTFLRTRLAPLLKRMVEEFGDRLFAVPGFRPHGNGASFTTTAVGIVVPVRDDRGLVVALKIRRRDSDKADGPRYYYLSGGEVSSGAPVHYPARPDDFDHERTVLRVTEGELKADVAFDRSGIYTVGLPGVGCWRRALHRLVLLEPPEVRVAFDCVDVETNRAVYEQFLAFILALREQDLRVVVETWPHAHKGIDDALQAGDTPVEQRGEDLETYLERLRVHYAPPATPPVEATVPPPTHAWVPAPFPVDVFPDSLRHWVENVAASKQCPVDFPAVACLTIAGAMIGSRRRFCVKPGWEETPSLYAVVVAPPGSRKSPAFKTCMAPVFERQRVLDEEYRNRLEGAGPGEKVAPMQNAFVENTTVEALTDVLAGNDRGVLLFKDELTAWVRGMDQYKGGKGTDRQFFLSGWAGVPILVNRKNATNGTVYINDPFLSVLGGIQPDMLGELSDSEGREDGFLHRILFSFPPEEGPAHWSSTPIDEQLRDFWAAFLTRLTDLPSDAAHGVLSLSDEARDRAWPRWYDAHQDERGQPGFPRQLQGPWSKMEAYMARFSLIVHMLHHVAADGYRPDAGEGEITPCDLARAARLVDYFKDHVRGVTRQLASQPIDPEVERLVGFCRTQEGSGTTLNTARRYLHLPTKSAVEALFKRAQDLGHGDVFLIKHAHGKPGKRFVLHGTNDAE